MENVKHLPVTNEPKGLQIQTWDDMISRAEYFAKSNLIPAALRNKPADIAIILQMGMEVGIPPLQAINGINVIQGKPSVSPELSIALIRSKVPDAYIKIESDERTQTVKCTMSRSRDRMDEAFTAVWDIQRATRMGYMQKDNYKTQATTMLKWRAVGEACRTVFPDVTKGLYLDEEMESFTGDGENKDQDKAARLTAMLNEDKKPAMKEVKAEVIQPEPSFEPEPMQKFDAMETVNRIRAKAQPKDEPSFDDFSEFEASQGAMSLGQSRSELDEAGDVVYTFGSVKGKKIRDVEDAVNSKALAFLRSKTPKTKEELEIESAVNYWLANK